MSGIDERLTNQSNQTNWQLPVRYGALGGYYFDSGQALGIKDYADASLGAPTFVGSAFTWGSGFLTVDNRNSNGCYIKLPFLDPVTTVGGYTSSDLSICCVVRANSAANGAFATSSPIFLSNYGGDANNTAYPSTKGLNISINGPGNIYWRDYELLAGVPTVVPTNLTFPSSPSTFDTFQAVLFTRKTVAGITTRTINVLTSGLTASSVSTAPPISNITQNFRIGNAPLNASGGYMDYTFLQVVNRAIAISEFWQAGSTPGRVQRRALVKTGVTV